MHTVTYPIRVMAKLGVKSVISTLHLCLLLSVPLTSGIVTNAAGALNPKLAVGTSTSSPPAIPFGGWFNDIPQLSASETISHCQTSPASIPCLVLRFPQTISDSYLSRTHTLQLLLDFSSLQHISKAYQRTPLLKAPMHGSLGQRMSRRRKAACSEPRARTWLA